MLSGFNKHTNWVRVQDYILRNEALLKEAETKGWPQTTINNIKYGLYTMRIREALHNNDFEKALSYADYVVPLSISPAQRRALSTNIAYIYMQLGKYDLAEKCFKDMLEKGVPSFNKGVNLLNYTHMLNLQGRYKETLEILDRYQDLSEYLDNDIYSSYLLGNRAIAESKVLGYDKAFQTLLRSKELGDSISYNSTVQDGFLLFDYSEQAMTIDSLKNSIKNKNILLAAFVTLFLFLVAFLCRILRERRQRTSEICALKRSLAETQNKYEKTEEARAELSQLGDSKLASQLLQVAAVEDTLNRIEELVKNKEEDLPQKIKLIGDLVSSSEAKGMVGRNLNIILNRLMQNFLRIFILLTPASLRGKSGFAPIL
ncbi:MAG: hypothetical protein K2H76_07975 [Muribaculaceae bacterium]|nr:hypothetical protein [Muribaculaceae bacterium]